MPKRDSEVDSNQKTLKKKLKSDPSMVHSFVRFLNCTMRRVDVVWLNYEGVGIRYRTLAPNQWVDVNTFVGHPWIFRDSLTGDKLVVQLKEVFDPPSWRNTDENTPPTRKTFNITIPVYTLKERCLQEVRRLLPASAVESLDIPRTLKVELLHVNSVLQPSNHNNNASSNANGQQLQNGQQHVNGPAS